MRRSFFGADSLGVRCLALPVLAWVLASAASGCTGSAAGGGTAGAAGSGGAGGSPGDESGGGGGGGEVETPECARGFEEPECSWSRVELPPWDLPPGSMVTAYAQEAEESSSVHRTYWLTGDESPCYWVSVAFGPDGPPGGPVSLVALVDGRQVPFVEPEATDVLVLLVPERAYSELQLVCVDAAGIEDGRHLLNLVLQSDGINFPTVTSFSFATVVYKNSFCTDDVAFVSAVDEEDHHPEQWEIRNRDTGEELLSYPGQVFATESGRLPVRMRLRRSGFFEETGDTLLFALLDYRQIPFGDLGPSPRIMVPELGERAVVDFDFSGLPTDGERHTLTIYRVHNFSSPTEDENGNRLPHPPVSFLVTDFWIREGG